MNRILNRKLRVTGWMGVLGIVGCLLMAGGCSTAPRTFDPEISGPQMIVNPASVSLGVASLTGTPIIFEGKGFDPGDSVFIQLIGVKRGDRDVHVPVADAEVNDQGRFQTRVSTLVKVTELLNAKIGSNEEMETVIVVSEPPIPAGTYTARAVSMLSDDIAVCRLTLREPSIGDRFKDWLGGVMGKIEKK